jgi:hypothetical protein
MAGGMAQNIRELAKNLGVDVLGDGLNSVWMRDRETEKLIVERLDRFDPERFREKLERLRDADLGRTRH